MTTAGDVNTQAGMAAHVYLVTQSMEDDYFYNADGELLVVPQQGALRFFTEFGRIEVEPGEICVIPRGVKFKVELVDGPARGYVCENYGAKFTLPDRGPIGANCLANPRDFKTPVAAFEDSEEKVALIGEMVRRVPRHRDRPLAARRGRLARQLRALQVRPAHFSPVGAILFDHPDPSIFTVLTAPSETAGTANIDFVIFPERWRVAEHTFRPPWYHMNIMSEFMGLIYGVYDAKPEGFTPGGISLHNCMLPHGPDKTAYDHATKTELKPVKLTGTMAFMFETRFPQHLTKYAAELETPAGGLRRLLDAAGEEVHRRQMTQPRHTRPRALIMMPSQRVLGDLPPGHLLLAEGAGGVERLLEVRVLGAELGEVLAGRLVAGVDDGLRERPQHRAGGDQPLERRRIDRIVLGEHPHVGGVAGARERRPDRISAARSTCRG